MARGSVVRSVKELGPFVTVTVGDPSRQLASEYRINVEISDDDLVLLRDQQPVSKRDQASLLASLPGETFQRKSKKRRNPHSFSPIIERVIRRLNELAATAYRPEAKSTGDHIRARLGEGFTETDLITVVEDRCARWLVDSKMRQYLRPATLFNSEKFEGYLQAAHGGNGAGDMDRKRTFING